MQVKCKKCDSEFTDQPNDHPAKVYLHQGEVICEDCLAGMGVLPDHLEKEHTKLLIQDNFYRMRPLL